jgi:hypothetical protein
MMVPISQKLEPPANPVRFSLRGRGLMGLPIHDALLVPTSIKSEVKDLMLQAFFDKVGFEGVVREEAA